MKSILTESTKSKFKVLEHKPKNVLKRIQGVLSDFKSNRNGRIYPRELWENVLNSDYVKEMIESHGLVGELDHPEERLEISLQNVSHVINDMWIEGDQVIGTIDILPTPSGKIVSELIDYGTDIGISSRGAGSVGPNNIVDADYQFVTFDFVARPSCEAARLNMIVEGVQVEIDNNSDDKVNAILEGYKTDLKEISQEKIDDTLSYYGLYKDIVDKLYIKNYGYIHYSPREVDSQEIEGLRDYILSNGGTYSSEDNKYYIDDVIFEIDPKTGISAEINTDMEYKVVPMKESQSQEIEDTLNNLRKSIPKIDKYLASYYDYISTSEPKPAYNKETDEINPEWEKWYRETSNVLYNDIAWNKFVNWVYDNYKTNINESSLKEDIFKNYYNKPALPAPGEEVLYGYDLSEVCDNVEKYFGLKNKREALNKIVEEHLDKKVIDEVMTYSNLKEGELMDKYKLSGDTKFRYQMLSRLQSDCKYVLGAANGYTGHLWVKDNPKGHCALMRELYNSLPEKPEWCTLEDIDRYEEEMLNKEYTPEKKYQVIMTTQKGPNEYESTVKGIYNSEDQASDICSELRSQGINATYKPLDESTKLKESKSLLVEATMSDQEVYKTVLNWYKQQIEAGNMTLNQCYELLSDKAKVSLNKMVDQSKIKEGLITKTINKLIKESIELNKKN